MSDRCQVTSEESHKLQPRVADLLLHCFTATPLPEQCHLQHNNWCNYCCHTLYLYLLPEQCHLQHNTWCNYCYHTLYLYLLPEQCHLQHKPGGGQAGNTCLTAAAAAERSRMQRCPCIHFCLTESVLWPSATQPVVPHCYCCHTLCLYVLVYTMLIHMCLGPPGVTRDRLYTCAYWGNTTSGGGQA